MLKFEKITNIPNEYKNLVKNDRMKRRQSERGAIDSDCPSTDQVLRRTYDRKGKVSSILNGSGRRGLALRLRLLCVEGHNPWEL